MMRVRVSMESGGQSLGVQDLSNTGCGSGGGGDVSVKGQRCVVMPDTQEELGGAI